jgi:hypothetical protein
MGVKQVDRYCTVLDYWRETNCTPGRRENGHHGGAELGQLR